MSQTPLEIGRHSRNFEKNRYVYAVLSRRAGGVSIGINLNPDKICNFDCIYCQVDRTTPPSHRDVDERILAQELESLLRRVQDGRLFQEPSFSEVPPAMRRVSDIAFAGDGEPTTYPRFREVVAMSIALKGRLGLADLKISLLTNCTVLHRPAIQEALRMLDRNQGEIWAKLDAGTEPYYEEICVPGGAKFQRILDNILQAAKVRPIVIQSLFMRVRGVGPPASEVRAFCDRLREVQAGGGTIRLVQIYTVARRPAQPRVTPLSDAEVDAIVNEVRKLTGLKAEGYYGSTSK